eukprot:2499852-Heterocapsa_arctica.AAC.1
MVYWWAPYESNKNRDLGQTITQSSISWPLEAAPTIMLGEEEERSQGNVKGKGKGRHDQRAWLQGSHLEGDERSREQATDLSSEASHSLILDKDCRDFFADFKGSHLKGDDQSREQATDPSSEAFPAILFGSRLRGFLHRLQGRASPATSN